MLGFLRAVLMSLRSRGSGPSFRRASWKEKAVTWGLRAQLYLGAVTRGPQSSEGERCLSPESGSDVIRRVAQSAQGMVSGPQEGFAFYSKGTERCPQRV